MSRYKIPDKVKPFLATLRRIPDEVILSVATRDMDMWSPTSCLCGTTLREYLVAFNGEPSFEAARDRAGWQYDGDTYLSGKDSEQFSCETFGGSQKEWSAIYNGVMNRRKLPLIEEAFTLRLSEACR